LDSGKGRPFERLTSAGGVIVRKADSMFEVALIFNDGLWLLPKGLVEEGEMPEEAALREVREETGLEGSLVDKIGEIGYTFQRGKRRYFKTVHLYLLKHTGGSTEAHDSEADEARWFPVAEALQVLAYPNEQRIVAKAWEMLRE